MKKLYFIRHGESVGNAKRLFTGQWDAPLTHLGRQQASVAAKQAGSLSIDCIVSSPLVRAQETAEIIADDIGFDKRSILYSDLLKERNYGDLQQKPYEAADGIDFESVPNIEPLASVEERARKAAEYLKSLDAESVLVVAHGTLGRALHMALLNDPSEPIEVPISQEIPNSEIIQWI